MPLRTGRTSRWLRISDIDESLVFVHDLFPDVRAHRPLLERQLVVLERLAEAGLQVALNIQAQCAEAGAAEAAMAFARVSRAVRQTILLQSRLRTDAKAGHDGNARIRKARVERIVTRVINAEIEDTDEAVGLMMDASERLEGDDIYGDVMTMPVSDLIARICEDLGLNPDWPSLMQEAWATEETEGLKSVLPPPPAGEGDPEGGGGFEPPLTLRRQDAPPERPSPQPTG
jgi:hypothetical protein